MIQQQSAQPLNEPQDHSEARHSIENGNILHAPIPLQLSIWEPPGFETIDLCMEVTAYVHHWQ